MGCICGGNNESNGHKRDKSNGEIDVMHTKQVSQKYNHNGEELKNKGISITQGTFIGEKKYNDFLKEYDILEFIGKGKMYISI